MHIALVYQGSHLFRQALDLEVLAPVLCRAGHQVTFVHDPNPFGVTDNVLQVPPLARWLSAPGRTVRRLLHARPDLVLFSVLPSTFAWAREVAAGFAASHGAPVVFSGLHPTLAPERVMQDPHVDYVIQGEVEEVAAPLARAVSRGEAPGRVGNLWYREEGRVRHTFRATLVDLDALPLPDKELFAPYVSYGYSYVAMVSRGCPNRCTFCEEGCMDRMLGPNFFRRRSVDTVMDELAQGLRRFDYKEVIFKDSYLSDDADWLAELMARYRREIGRPFKCFCSIRGFSEQKARLLKEGGCYCVEFGLQTWNEPLRRRVLGRGETNEEARKAFSVCADQDLWYDVDHMFDLPGETLQDYHLGAMEYKVLRHLNRVKVHFLIYHPTAPIIQHGVEAGALPPDAPRLLEEGADRFFYSHKEADPRRRGTLEGYAALYKLLPALPSPALHWLLRRSRFRWLGRIPAPVMAALMGLLALRSGDLRFSAHLRLYPRKVLRGVRQWVEVSLWDEVSPHDV